MRIAQVSTLATPVRRERSDSIEYLVWLLSRELTRLGHAVTVFAAAGSEVCGELVATLPGPYGMDGSPDDWQLCEWINLCRAVEQSARFDVLHSHAYLWGLPLQPLAHAPMIHTTHIIPQPSTAYVWSLAPAPVCLVLDDVHEIPAASLGAGLLARLAVDLPSNGHLVLASREPVPRPLSRP